MLDPLLLSDEAVLESALGTLEGHIQNSAVDCEQLVRDLLSTPKLFEYIFSSKYSYAYSLSYSRLRTVLSQE